MQNGNNAHPIRKTSLDSVPLNNTEMAEAMDSVRALVSRKDYGAVCAMMQDLCPVDKLRLYVRIIVDTAIDDCIVSELTSLIKVKVEVSFSNDSE